MYDVDYFIKKFEAIPLNQWCKYSYINSKGQSCATGHCGVRVKRRSFYSPPILTEEGAALLELLPDVEQINDGDHKDFTQETSKGRVLAALYDLKADQEIFLSIS